MTARSVTAVCFGGPADGTRRTERFEYGSAFAVLDLERDADGGPTGWVSRTYMAERIAWRPQGLDDEDFNAELRENPSRYQGWVFRFEGVDLAEILARAQLVMDLARWGWR